MELIELRSIIKEFRISMPKLSKKIGIGYSSFKKKIEPEKYDGYRFSDEEIVKLEKAISELKERITISNLTCDRVSI